MNEFQLKYGCNPNQKPSRIFMEDGSDLPVEILNGRPGYINFLDAFNGPTLVKELKKATTQYNENNITKEVYDTIVNEEIAKLEAKQKELG